MHLSFDLNDAQERATAIRIITTFDADRPVSPATADADILAAAATPVAATPVAPDAAARLAAAEANMMEAPIDPKAGVELDVNGTPWLAEVHAGNKSKVKSGAWKKKRGVEDEECAEAEAAARAKIASTPTPIVPAEDVMPTTPIVPAEDVMPTMPAAALPTGLPGLPMAAPVERSIQEVSSAWGQAVQDGKIDPAKALELYAQLGIDGSKLASSVEMRGKLYDHLASL